MDTELSKQEINLQIAELVYPDVTIYQDAMNDSVLIDDAIKYDRGMSFNVDYCNNMNDLMSLVFKYNITLEVYENGSARVGRYFEHKNPKHIVTHKDPAIAMCLCLVKVLEEESYGH